jgi:hypothetical protein
MICRWARDFTLSALEPRAIYTEFADVNMTKP